MKKAFLTDKDALVRGIPEEVDAVFLHGSRYFDSNGF